MIMAMSRTTLRTKAATTTETEAKKHRRTTRTRRMMTKILTRRKTTNTRTNTRTKTMKRTKARKTTPSTRMQTNTGLNTRTNFDDEYAGLMMFGRQACGQVDKQASRLESEQEAHLEETTLIRYPHAYKACSVQPADIRIQSIVQQPFANLGLG